MLCAWQRPHVETRDSGPQSLNAVEVVLVYANPDRAEAERV